MDRPCTSQGDPHSAPDVPSFNRQSDDSIQRLSNPLPTAWVSSQLRPTSACHSVELLRRGDFRYLVSGLSIPFDKDPIQLEECLQTSTTNGLTDAEARIRLASSGQNVMKGQRRCTGWAVLWKQVSNAMTAILVGCLIIAFATRDYPEGGVIAGILLLHLSTDEKRLLQPTSESGSSMNIEPNAPWTH
jgi:magnesium-transporting ATPase (P-type)